MEPQFLNLEDVLQIHHHLIEQYGGSHGIRDLGLLQSALAMPATTFGGEFLHDDFFAMAAAYLFHVVCNHPFVDGNKRTGSAAAFAFLELNGVSLKASEKEFEDMVRCVAEGRIDKDEIAIFLRESKVQDN